MTVKLINPYRSPDEYQAWLRGVRDVAQVLDVTVDDVAFGGGIPQFLTMNLDTDGETEDTDTAAVPDSPGPAADGEPDAPS